MYIIVVTYLLLSTAIVANKVSLNSVSPIALVSLKLLVAAFFLFIFLYKKNNLPSYQVIKNNLPIIFVTTIFTGFLPQIFKSFALKHLPAGNATLFGSFDPFVTILLSYFLFNEKVSLKSLLAIFCAFFGFLILALDFSNLSGLLKFNFYSIIAILAVFGVRFGWLLTQKLIRVKLFDPFQINLISCFLGGLMSLCASLSIEEKLFININYSVIILILYSGIVGHAISLTMYNFLLKSYTSSYLSIFSLLVPIFVSILGFFIFSEPITPKFIISFFCLILAFLFK